jgi:hypothetical protein
MRQHAPFQPDDLRHLDDFLLRARVVAMEDIYDGDGRPDTIGMRHDCDNVIEPAVEFARWEAARGYRSTYYVLHTAPYWRDKTLLRESLDAIAECGHEIGIHNDAITEKLETGKPAAWILHEAVKELRGYGHTIRSTVAHGNARCHTDNYVNDELWRECRRRDYGRVERLGVTPASLKDLGLDFDANWLPRGDYLSDSGGHWSKSYEHVADEWGEHGQLHMLVHPDWWPQAFQTETVAA